jgi:hypothetical protein
VAAAAAAAAAAPGAGAGDLFAMAAASINGLAPGATASLSIVHAWHYPHFFFYRDAFTGSDNGVRYASYFDSAAAAATSLNLTQIAANILSWQDVFSGLPDPALADAAFNLFAHSRSSMWFHERGEEYRQWESLEFTDYLNPTNGDERHLPYFHLAPEAMRSQLRMMVAHARNADGMFYCVSVAGANDAQYGNDPCGPSDHPDDIAMFMVGTYELFALANDTAFVDEVYESAILPALGYYKATYDSTPWHLPYQVHETYDAVPLTPTITGEGNLGTSLYNCLNYLTALNCMLRLAQYRDDNATAAEVAAMLARATASVERNLWQPGATPSFIGDTVENYGLFTEPTNGFAYHSSDGLHGQVLAYRLGFGDLLPRTWMQLHQSFASDDLITPFGLSFSKFSGQSWIMSDHSNGALRLRWNDERGFDTSLAQIRYWRNTRRELTKNAAVIYTQTGLYALLNYYGYALFYYHTLAAFSGLVANLPSRSIAFAPHFSAFSAAGDAAVPVLLGGSLGVLRLSNTSAELSLAFLAAGSAPLSFLSVAICQHTFAAGPYDVAPGSSVQFALPSPCASALPSSASTVASAAYCTAAPAANASASAVWAQAAGAPLTATRDECLAFVEAHRYCGYAFDSASGACSPVAGAACYLVDGAAPRPASVEVGFVACNYSGSGYAPPRFVNTSSPTLTPNATFAAFEPLDSPVYSIAAPDEAACAALAARAQSCGYQWSAEYGGAALGSCGTSALARGCCVLNPTSPASGGCAPGDAAGPEWPNAVVAVFEPPPPPPPPSPACMAAGFKNMSNVGGVATLPTNHGFLSIVYAVSWEQCFEHCCATSGCVTWAFYETSTPSPTQCNFFGAAYDTGPQPWPSGNVHFAQGAVLVSPPSYGTCI